MSQIDYLMMPWYKKIPYRIYIGIKGIVLGLIAFIIAIPKRTVKICKTIGGGVLSYFRAFRYGDIKTKLSFIIMGASNALRGQIIKGILFLIGEIAFIIYMVKVGVSQILGLRHLGLVEQGWTFDEELGIDILAEGDNSMLILLYGVFAMFIVIGFILLYISNIRAAVTAEEIEASGKKLPTFAKDIKDYFDGKFYKTLLTMPIIGVLMFTIIPLVYMILIAFTNYDNMHQPPGKLFTWIGFGNFKTMLVSNGLISSTFWPILGWTLIWAVFATGLNYILGILLAMMINKKGIKYKPLWRTIFITSMAIPQFVSLLVMKNMLNAEGPINVLLKNWGLIERSLPFLTDGNWARVVVIVVNLWIGIPYSMLITSGILMNIPDYLYESAKIDGASPVRMFRHITLPYVLFVTTPYLITQFIGNINNFNVIYFLTGGGPSTLEYYQAGKTDLLVTWLYKLTVNSKDYCYASTIGILVFVLSAVFSLIAFRRSSAYKNEEVFQ